MPNMSYCRNENTYHDLEDALEYITQVAESDRDERYRRRLIHLILDAAESLSESMSELSEG